GRLARSGRRPADRNCGEQSWGKRVPIGSNRCSHSVRRVAGRPRRVACATWKPFSQHGLRAGFHPKTWNGRPGLLSFGSEEGQIAIAIFGRIVYKFRMKLFPVVAVTLLGFPLVLATAADAAETEWKAGFATVMITPEKPVPMAGYAARTKPFEGVAQDIYAKALALEDRQGHRAVLVTTDLIGLARAVAEPVYKRIQEKTKLARNQILLSSSHTHSAPTLSIEERAEGGVTPEDSRNTVAYTRDLQGKLVEVAAQAISRLQPAQLSWGSGVAHFAMNRREFTPRGVILGVNPRGLVDRSVPVLRVDSADGKFRAVLFDYACHNTTLTQTNFSLCGDYAGFAQAYIQE